MKEARSFTIRMDTSLHHDDAQLNKAFQRVDAARVELHQAMQVLDDIIARFNVEVHCDAKTMPPANADGKGTTLSA